MERMPSFGEVLRQVRKARRLSQDRLGAKAGLNGQTISNIETGNIEAPRGETYEAIAAALEMTPQELDELWMETAGRMILSEELTAKIREFAAREERDPLEFLEAAVADAEPTKPGEKRGGTKKIARVPRRAAGRLPPTADKSGHAAANS